MNVISKILKIIMGIAIGLVVTFFLAAGLDLLWINSARSAETLGHPIPAFTLMWFLGIPVIVFPSTHFL